MAEMTRRERIMAATRKERADKLPFFHYWRHSQIGWAERQCRNRGMGMNWVRPPFTVKLHGVEIQETQANINNTYYGSYQGVSTDNPVVPSSSAFVYVDNAIICNYIYRSYDFDRRRSSFFDRPGHVLDYNDYPTNAAGWITNAFAQPTNCADSAIKSLEWQKRNLYSYQNKA